MNEKPDASSAQSNCEKCLGELEKSEELLAGSRTLRWSDYTVVTDDGDDLLTFKKRRLIWADIGGIKFLLFRMDVENHGWNNINNIEYRSDQFLVNLRPDAANYMHISIDYEFTHSGGTTKLTWLVGAMPLFCGAGIGSHCAAATQWNYEIPTSASADFTHSACRVNRC